LAPVRVCPQNPGAATAAAAEDILRNLLTLAGALRLLGLIAVLSGMAPALGNEGGADAAAGARADHPPATLRILNRDIVTMRASLAGSPPAVRVQRARDRLRDIPESAIDQPINVVPLVLGQDQGVQFLLGDHLLFAVLRGDVDPEAKQSFDALVAQTRSRVEDARKAWHASRDTPLLLRGLLRSAIATLVLGLAIWIVYRLSRRAVEWMERKRDILAARHEYVDWREFLARLAVGTMQLVQWFVLIVLGYSWLNAVLGSFVATTPIAHQLGAWLLGRLAWVADGLLHSLPGLVTIVIVLVVTRAVVDVLGYFFEAVQKGRLRVPMIHPETTGATRRIITLVAWGLGIAVAYPYLPGSDSEAFKGLSVLFGLMITLGSTGLVTQAMSGLVVIYSRSLRKGDFVEVNGAQGVVTEVSSLATKIINVRNEEITIPNSVLISAPIRNFSKLSGTQGTLLTTKVTIGYDTPWRQVHALLIEAAQKTPGVRATPMPYVYQRALSDFYVEYELYASIDRALDRIPILSALHASIQDCFNEHGVQIMSPHFLGQPDSAVVVARQDWYRAPAQPPSGG
jgi:small-conductance mechanosensitive channel